MNVPESPYVETVRKPSSRARIVACVAAFPDLLKGALEASATRFTDGVLVAAAHARAKRAGAGELRADLLNLVTQRSLTAAPGLAATEPVSIEIS